MMEKDINGKILFCDDTGLEKFEYYKCDYCNKTFKTTVKMTFNSYIESKYDPNAEYITELYKKDLFLDED